MKANFSVFIMLMISFALRGQVDIELINQLNNPRTRLEQFINGKFIDRVCYYQSGFKNDSRYSMLARAKPEMHKGDWSWPDSPIQIVDSSGRLTGMRYLCRTIIQLYRYAFENYYPSDQIKKMVIMEGVPFEKEPSFENGRRWEEWAQRNSFCYENNIRSYNMEGGHLVLQQDLAKYFKVEGKIEEWPLTCYVMYCMDTTAAYKKLRSIKSVDGTNLKDFKLANFFGTLATFDQREETPIVLNETGLTTFDDLHIKADATALKDMRLLAETLSRYSIILREEARLLKVLVLSPQNNSSFINTHQ